MPKEFEDCISKGGKVRTISGPNKLYNIGKGEYIKICVHGNKVYRGHTHKKGAGK